MPLTKFPSILFVDVAIKFFLAKNFTCEQIHIPHQSAGRLVITCQRGFCVQKLSSSLGVFFCYFSHSLSCQLPKNGVWELNYQRCSAMNPSHCKGPCLQWPGAVAFACGGTQIGALGRWTQEVERSYSQLHSSLVVKWVNSHIGATPLGQV